MPVASIAAPSSRRAHRSRARDGPSPCRRRGDCRACARPSPSTACRSRRSGPAAPRPTPPRRRRGRRQSRSRRNCVGEQVSADDRGIQCSRISPTWRAWSSESVRVQDTASPKSPIVRVPVTSSRRLLASPRSARTNSSGFASKSRGLGPLQRRLHVGASNLADARW